MRIKTRATREELYKVEGKAELVNGEIVCMSPTGRKPARAGLRIAAHLLQHEERVWHAHEPRREQRQVRVYTLVPPS